MTKNKNKNETWLGEQRIKTDYIENKFLSALKNRTNN